MIAFVPIATNAQAIMELPTIFAAFVARAALADMFALVAISALATEVALVALATIIATVATGLRRT